MVFNDFLAAESSTILAPTWFSFIL